MSFFFNKVMEKTLKFLVIAALLINFSCSKNNGLDQGKLVEVPIESINQTIDHGPLIDTLWKVRLELTDKNLIAKCHNLLCYDDYIYVHDNSQGKIFIFKNNGKYVSKIDQKGKGPNEYLIIQDVFINQKGEVVVCDAYKNTLFYFSPTGKYLNKKKLSRRLAFYSMKELGNGNNIYFTGRMGNDRKSIINHDILIETDDDLILKIPNKGEFKAKMRSPDSYIFQNSNQFFFQSMFKNVIYEVNNLDVRPLYNISFGRKTIPKEAFFENDYQEFESKYINSNDYVGILGAVQATPNHFIIPLFINRKYRGNLWLSRSSHKIIGARKVKISENEYLSMYPRSTKGDTIVCISDEFEFTSTESNVEMSEELNPLLTFYRLKRF